MHISRNMLHLSVGSIILQVYFSKLMGYGFGIGYRGRYVYLCNNW